MTKPEARTYVLDHFSYDNGKRISNTRKLRDAWLFDAFKIFIDRLSDTDKKSLRDNRNINNSLYSNLPTVRVVCGECSSTHTINKSLEMGFHVEVICGNHLSDNDVKSTLMSLKSKYGDKFKLYIYGYDSKTTERTYPESHSTNIGSNLLYENKHMLDPKKYYETTYDKAFVIENVPDDMLQDYIKRFDELKSESREFTSNKEIDTLPTL